MHASYARMHVCTHTLTDAICFSVCVTDRSDIAAHLGDLFPGSRSSLARED